MKKVYALLLVLTLLLAGCQKKPDAPSGGTDATLSSATATPATENYTESPKQHGSYIYEEQNGVIRIVKHTDVTVTEITVPEEIDGKPVEVLGDNAFYQHKNVTKIILPETLRVIEGGAFYRCYSLQTIFIPKDVETIASDPFFRSSSLTEITVDPENEYFTSQDGILYDKNKETLIAYPEGKETKEYTIPATVKYLSGAPFGYHPKLERLIVPASFTAFPDGNMFIFPDDIVLIVAPGSEAEKYAQKHELAYQVKDTAPAVTPMTLEQLRAQIKAEGKLFGVAYLGGFEGDAQSARAELLEQDYIEALPFLKNVTNYAEQNGCLMFCVVPADDSVTLSVCEYVFADQPYVGEEMLSTNQPVLLRGNVSDVVPNLCVIATKGAEQVEYCPNLSGRDGSLTDNAKKIYDFSPYYNLYGPNWG